MKPLPATFTKKGFLHTVVQRDGDVAIVCRKKHHYMAPHYEVIIVQKHSERVIAGVTIPASEGYPHSELWGKAGWTYGDFASAKVRFDALVANAGIQVEIPATLTTQTTIPAYDTKPHSP